MTSPVRETRVAITVADFTAAVMFYRDALGLPVLQEWSGNPGRGVVLDAGRATIELLDAAQTDEVDRIEVGRVGVSGRIRLALEVADSAGTAARLIDAGAGEVGVTVVTPWGHRNSRVADRDGVQLTLFEVPA